MKRKIFTVQPLFFVLLFASLRSTLCTALITSNSESSLNQLSSRTSSSYERFFYHTTNGALPFDREITIYIFSGEAKRMYYQVHNTKPDIALTVTPCEDTIEWKLRFIEEKTHKRGLYIIDFNSNGKDVSAKLFLSQHYPYPLLPNDSDIKILSMNNDRVLINWNTSPSEADTPIQYCIAISSKRHFVDNCQLDIQTKDSDEQYELDLLPSAASTSFAYWWGKTVKKMLRQSKVQSIADQNLNIECIGKQTWHTISKLKSKVNYFIDVFAKNSVTNATSMYLTLNLTLIDKEPIKIKENEQMVIKLNSENNYTKYLKYNLSSRNQEKLWLFVQSCSGPGPLNITAKTHLKSSENVSKVLFVSKLFDMKTIGFTTDSNISQILTIEVSSGMAAEKSAVVLFSRKHSKFPFPRLPDDRKIKVLETLTDCDSVTLAWTASPDDKVLYCVYQREAHNHHSVFEQPKNLCNHIDNNNNNDINESDSNSAGKVLCRRYHKSSKRRFNNVIMQSIKGLSPGTRYVFQVMLTKYRGRTLSYEQVWVSTKSKYQCQ